MPPHFGRRVIGDVKYEEQAKKAKTGATHFGHRVIGKPAAPAPAVVASDGEQNTDAVQNPPTDPTTTTTPPAAGVSIAEMQKLLTDNTALVDELLAAEEQRVEGPRKGALRALLNAEVGEGGAARESVIDHIAGLLESKQSPVQVSK